MKELLLLCGLLLGFISCSLQENYTSYSDGHTLSPEQKSEFKKIEDSIQISFFQEQGIATCYYLDTGAVCNTVLLRWPNGNYAMGQMASPDSACRPSWFLFNKRGQLIKVKTMDYGGGISFVTGYEKNGALQYRTAKSVPF